MNLNDQASGFLEGHQHGTPCLTFPIVPLASPLAEDWGVGALSAAVESVLQAVLVRRGQPNVPTGPQEQVLLPPHDVVKRSCRPLAKPIVLQLLTLQQLLLQLEVLTPKVLVRAGVPSCGGVMS